MYKLSSIKKAISEYRNSDFQISGFAISSHKNIQYKSVRRGVLYFCFISNLKCVVDRKWRKWLTIHMLIRCEEIEVRGVVMLGLVILATLNAILETTIASEVASSEESVILIDWIQVTIDLFVTFFGFALAILGGRATDWYKTRKETKELKKLIKEELRKVYDELESFNEETLDVQPLKIPSWESAINTGQVSLFDFVTRNKLFCVYNTINEFNSWCLVHTNYYFKKGMKNKLLIKELNKIKKGLLCNESNESASSISSAIEILERRKTSNGD